MFFRPGATVLALYLFGAPGMAEEDAIPEKRGWFWYQDPPPVETMNEDRRETQWTNLGRIPLPPPPDAKQLMALHPEEFRPMMVAYLEEAVWQPTPKTLANYLKVHDAARRKALAFTAASQFALLNTPQYDMNREIPVTAPGRRIARAQRTLAIDDYLADSKQQFALLFFTDPRCQYCSAQRGLLEQFIRRHDWQMRSIDIVRSPQRAATFGVDYTPTIILIKRDEDKWLTVASGVVSLPQLEANVYRAARYMQGDIEAAQFLARDRQIGGLQDPLAAPALVRERQAMDFERAMVRP